jgi:DNA mismatch endonuclease, patch repair protein
LLRERNIRFGKEWWTKHPEAKATLTQVSRPTSIESLARESILRRGIQMIVSKRLENVCYPDIILPTLKIALFCHGCFWHACPFHNPVVPSWLRAKIKDQFVEEELNKRGWKTLVIWEHEFKIDKDAAGLKLDAMLNSTSSVS